MGEDHHSGLNHQEVRMNTALVTGASRGLGFALSQTLVDRSWHVIVDARDPAALAAAARDLGDPQLVTWIPGDVSDPSHRADLVRAVEEQGHLDLLVNNASTLGPTPLPHLSEYPIGELRNVLEVNTIAPLALLQAVLPAMAVGGKIVNVTSDAAVEPYEGWGGYGASKASLEQLSAILGVEHPNLRIYSFDPGDMRTEMHQAAFPGEDISDRPLPESVVPSLLRLIDEGPPSGRYRASDLPVPVASKA
jgi:NAD(P)-dependent dehydrogenase (short-subunit alcohol dehydrogenase family)